MLISLTARLERQIDGLIAEANALAVGSTFGVAERRRAEHLSFHLQLIWDRYVRSFVLISASGIGTDSAGAVLPSVPIGSRSTEAACHYLMNTYRKRRQEPDWYKPPEAIDAAQRLAISNFGKFSGAIGSTPWLIDELRISRNFFAHRSKASALAVRNLPWFSDQTIGVESTMFIYDSSGVRKFEAWGQFMKLVSQAMI